MKEIDEKTLLLAVGSVDSDLIEWAETVSAPQERSLPLRRLAALAACCCLALGLAAPWALRGWSGSGSSSSGAEAETITEENAEAREDAADLAAASALEALGIFSAEDLAGAAAETAEESAVDAAKDTQSAAENESLSGSAALPETAAEWYAWLAAAQPLLAAEDEEAFDPVLTVTFTLSDGSTIEGYYDPARSTLELGEWRFIKGGA